MLTRHTDRVRLAAHRYVTRRAVQEEYGALPARMRLVVLPISTFGAIGAPGHAFIGELSRRMRAACIPVAKAGAKARRGTWGL